MRKAIAYGITFLLLCQVVGCGQTPAAATETATATETVADTQTAETTEAVAEESTEEASASGVPEPKVNENGDIEEYEQHKYGNLTRYIIKRDGMDQTEEWLEFSSPVVVIDNSSLTMTITHVFCTVTADGRTSMGYCYDIHNNLKDRRMCALGTDEKVAGQYVDFPYSNGGWTVYPDSTSSMMEGTDDITGKTYTIDDMCTLEGAIQCDREKNGSFGGDSENIPFSLKNALAKLN